MQGRAQGVMELEVAAISWGVIGPKMFSRRHSDLLAHLTCLTLDSVRSLKPRRRKVGVSW